MGRKNIGISHLSPLSTHPFSFLPLRSDLEPYVPLEEAWKLTAKIVAAFLALHLCPQVCACVTWVWMSVYVHT